MEMTDMDMIKSGLRKTKRFILAEGHRLRTGRPAGYIFMLHRVSEKDPSHLDANENMKVSPKFLASFLDRYRERYDYISLGDVPGRLCAQGKKRQFMAFTLDDGYLDNYTNALPVFSDFNTPFTVFAATEYMDGDAALWWYELEDLLLNQDVVQLSTGEMYTCSTKEQKEEAFLSIREKVLHLDQTKIKEEFRELLGIDFDYRRKCTQLMMSWDDLCALSNEKLVTIGAHTHHHYNLKQLQSEDFVKTEIETGCNKIQQRTGKTPNIFAYPFGSAYEVSEREIHAASEMNFDLACIAYGGYCSRKHSDALYALPRIMLMEDFDERLL